MVTPLYVLTSTSASRGPDAERLLLLEVFLVLWERCPLYPESGHTALNWILACANQTLELDEFTTRSKWW
jgi:hypothetical protein